MHAMLFCKHDSRSKTASHPFWSSQYWRLSWLITWKYGNVYMFSNQEAQLKTQCKCLWSRWFINKGMTQCYTLNDHFDTSTVVVHLRYTNHLTTRKLKQNCRKRILFPLLFSIVATLEAKSLRHVAHPQNLSVKVVNETVFSPSSKIKVEKKNMRIPKIPNHHFRSRNLRKKSKEQHLNFWLPKTTSSRSYVHLFNVCGPKGRKLLLWFIIAASMNLGLKSCQKVKIRKKSSEENTQKMALD